MNIYGSQRIAIIVENIILWCSTPIWFKVKCWTSDRNSWRNFIYQESEYSKARYVAWKKKRGDELSISFACRAFHDIRVFFSATCEIQKEDENLKSAKWQKEMYQICLGCNHNRESYITKGCQGTRHNIHVEGDALVSLAVYACEHIRSIYVHGHATIYCLIQLHGSTSRSIPWYVLAILSLFMVGFIEKYENQNFW